MGIMDQAAGIVRGDGAGEATAEPSRSRPVLSLSGTAPKVAPEHAIAVPQNAPVTEATVRDALLNGHRMDAEQPAPVQVEAVASEPAPPETASDVPDQATAGTAPVEAASVDASAQSLVDGMKPEAAVAPAEDAEHEAIEIARKAKEGEQPSQDASQSNQVDDAEPVDPVAAAIAAAGAGVDPAEPTAGAVSTEVVPPSSEPGAEPKKEMDYHQALSHINRKSARLGHLDIDDRISEYVRTNRREALDKPARSTVKRVKQAQKNGIVDHELVEARRVVAGGISSKDVSIQVAIDQMEARKGKGGDQIKSLTKGPAAAADVDPSVMAAAAAKTKAAPGL